MLAFDRKFIAPPLAAVEIFKAIRYDLFKISLIVVTI